MPSPLFSSAKRSIFHVRLVEPGRFAAINSRAKIREIPQIAKQHLRGASRGHDGSPVPFELPSLIPRKANDGILTLCRSTEAGASGAHYRLASVPYVNVRRNMAKARAYTPRVRGDQSAN